MVAVEAAALGPAQPIGLQAQNLWSPQFSSHSRPRLRPQALWVYRSQTSSGIWPTQLQSPGSRSPTVAMLPYCLSSCALWHETSNYVVYYVRSWRVCGGSVERFLEGGREGFGLDRPFQTAICMRETSLASICRFANDKERKQ